MVSKILEKCPLFEGVEQNQIGSLLECLSAKQSSYKKEEFIFRAGDPALHVGIVLTGGANVMQEDFWGNRTILTHVEPGELFGEAFSWAGAEQLPVNVIATKASDIMLFDYRKIITVCSDTCPFHPLLISNMLQILADKNIMLTRKIGYLSQRTTKEKLLAFLSAQAIQQKNHEITIPYNRQELADYLCVERSALSRELARMKGNGLLDYEKNWFKLRD